MRVSEPGRQQCLQRRLIEYIGQFGAGIGGALKQQTHRRGQPGRRDARDDQQTRSGCSPARRPADQQEADRADDEQYSRVPGEAGNPRRYRHARPRRCCNGGNRSGMSEREREGPRHRMRIRRHDPPHHQIAARGHAVPQISADISGYRVRVINAASIDALPVR